MLHKVMTEAEQKAFEAGRDYAANGASLRNCHYGFFSTPEKTKAWERGRDAENANGE